MVDTLPASRYILSDKFTKKNEPPYISSITEPDNGHKTEPLNKLDYKEEAERLKSFNNWTSQVVTPGDLAKAGFYFLNNSSVPDLVKCAFCNAEICRWETGDEAMSEHMKYAPNCPFVRRHRQQDGISALPRGQDVCGNFERFGNSVPERETFRRLNNRVHEGFEDEKCRLESFSSWPNEKPTGRALAEAGFYYRSIDDQTTCFSCGNSLKNWEEDDDAWEQHAKWFPKCKFLLEKKGEAFVKEVQKQEQAKANSVPCVTKEEKSSDVSEKDTLLCHMCDANERNVIFMPCNHILACEKCAAPLKKCPVCREMIVKRMKVFLS